MLFEDESRRTNLKMFLVFLGCTCFVMSLGCLGFTFASHEAVQSNLGMDGLDYTPNAFAAFATTGAYKTIGFVGLPLGILLFIVGRALPDKEDLP